MLHGTGEKFDTEHRVYEREKEELSLNGNWSQIMKTLEYYTKELTLFFL